MADIKYSDLLPNSPLHGKMYIPVLDMEEADPEDQNKLVLMSDIIDAVEITWSDLMNLYGTEQMTPGVYFITDAGGFSAGVYVTAITESLLSPVSFAIFYDPDFQSMKTVNVGCWSSSLTGLISGVSVCVWNGIQYLSTTGVAGVNNPSISVGGWVAILKSSEYYMPVCDAVIYDLVNDTISFRVDSRGNEITTPDTFQWGSDQVKNNKGKFDILNQRGSFKDNNNLGTSTVIATDVNIGTISGSTIFGKGGDGVFCDFYDVNCGLRDCTIEVKETIVFDGYSLHENRTHVGDFSNFKVDVFMDSTQFYDSNIITIPDGLQYGGNYRMVNDSGLTIQSIEGLSRYHRSAFSCENGSNMEFNTVAVSSAFPNNIVSPLAPTTLIIQGRANGRDSLVFAMAGNVVQLIESKINA